MKKKSKYKITKEDILKMHKRINRALDLESGVKHINKVHLTSKKDAEEKIANTVREYDSVHDAHCCPDHGCKYGDTYCPVEEGHEAGVDCEICYGFWDNDSY